MFDEPLINILVVEDDERLASLTRDYLVRHGTAVTIVDNGEDGLREATGGNYDMDRGLAESHRARRIGADVEYGTRFALPSAQCPPCTKT
jgi:CheY-like chemotaxis protein